MQPPPKKTNKLNNNKSFRLNLMQKAMALNSFPWSINNGFQYNTQLYIYIYIPAIDTMVRVFTNAPGDLGSISGRVIPKTQKMVLDASLLNTQQYKVRIKGKMEQSRERSSALT